MWMESTYCNDSIIGNDTGGHNTPKAITYGHKCSCIDDSY